jgi:hypothetical protein
MENGLRWVLAAAVLLLPGAVLACPNCAAVGEDTTSTTFLWLVGTMMLLPFPAAGAMIWILRSER